MDLLASLPKQRSQFCLLAFHMASIMTSNKYCFMAHCTLYCTPYITHQLLSNDSWFI